jgi:arylsulfatase A-like enzyme/Flp pilus assembly protein TadD
MPSAPKPGVRSPTPRGPVRAPHNPERSRSRSLKRPAYLAAGLLAVLVFVWLRGRSPAIDLPAITNQNVLLITIDTLRADALGSYGGQAATPALDRLAEHGVRFDFAHAHATLTLPSHTTILTGRYPFQHGVRDNSGYRVPPDTVTLATLLKKAGYATAAFVGAFPLHSRFGLGPGFDVYDDRFGETRAPTEFVMPERSAPAVVALARAWIAKHQSERWFAWVHVFDPHAPYSPPPPFDRQYSGRPYYGEVAATDAALGPLLDDVQASGHPTLAVVTGDHGEALGDHGEETHGLFAYEATLRVPLIIAEATGPAEAGHYRGNGEVSPIAARHVDILPTILAAIGQPIPPDLPGRSLRTAADRDRASHESPPSYFEAMSAMLNRGWAPLSGVIVNRDKYIDLPLPERYDLSADSAERVNLAGRAPDRDRVLVAVLRAFGAARPGERRTEDADAAARLRALGYVSSSAPVKARYTEADDPKALVPIDQAMHRGVSLYSERRYDEAARVYEDIIRQRPDMALAYRHLAFIAWQTGNVAQAIDTLRRALRGGIAQRDVTTQLGTYLAESGNPREAITLLEPVLKAEQPDLDALNGLGIALAREGRSSEAHRVFERMSALNPASGMAMENLGALDLAAGNLAGARARFERALAIAPDSSQAHAGLAVVLLKSGDRRGAIESFRKAVELDATNYDALYNLASTLLADGRQSDARPYIEQFVGTAPPALYAKDIRELSAVLQRVR